MHVMKAGQIDSPPLSSEEIADIEEFYNNPKDRRVVTLTELLAELNGDQHVEHRQEYKIHKSVQNA